MLTVLNGFSRFVYLCVLLQRVLFNNAGCGTRCKSGRSSGASPFPGVKELPSPRPARLSAPRLLSQDGDPLPAASERFTLGGDFFPGLGVPHPPVKAKQQANLGGGRASPQAHARSLPPRHSRPGRGIGCPPGAALPLPLGGG